MSILKQICSIGFILMCISPCCCIQAATAEGLSRLPEQIFFRNFTIDDGLAVNKVRSIIQDRDGFMWFATNSGLNRFDGYDISLITYSTVSDELSNSQNSVYVLYFDSCNRIWIGRENLSRYDPKTNKAKAYDVSNNLGIRVIRGDGDGNLWLGGERFGLRKFNTKTEVLDKVYLQNDGDHSIESDSINDIFLDKKGRVWVASDKGFFALDEKREILFSPVGDHPLKEAVVSALAGDHKGRIWIGTWQGLFRFTPETGEIVSFLPDASAAGSQDTIHNSQIHSLHCDRAGNIWVGTDKQGVAVFEANREQFRHYPAGIDDPYRLGLGAVDAIFEDRDGGIWFAIQGFGLYRFDPNNQIFRYYPPNPNNPDMLSFPQILSIEQDGDNGIWVATDGGGLNKLVHGENNANSRFIQYRHDPADPESISSDSVIGLVREDDGDLWIGTWSGGLNKYNPKSDRFSHWKSESPLASNNIFTLYIDSKKQLWISTWGVGVQILDLKTEKFNGVLRGNPGADRFSMRNDNVMAILEDEKGIMWFGGYNGLDKYNPEDGTFYNYNIKDKRKSNLRHNTIFAIYQDRKNRIWLATENGLHHFDRETETFNVYSVADGLASPNIVGILEDDDGNLWLSSRHGLIRFDPETRKARNYYREEGLQSNEFKRFAFERLTSGELVFGGVNGFNIFDPAMASRKRDPPKVTLTSLLLYNNPVTEYDGKRLKNVISYADQVHLLPNDDTVSLTFSALEYSTPASVQYRYKLEQLDADWLITDANRRIATYTQLSPGEYQFRVQARFERSGWGPERDITLMVQPHWWETTLFYLLTVSGSLVVLGILLWLWLSRIKATILARQRIKEAAFLRERNQELARINNELEILTHEKDDLLHVMAHDLRNPLNFLSLSVQLLLRKSEKFSPAQQKGKFKDMLKMITRLVDIINTMVDEKKEDNSDCGDRKSSIIPVNQSVSEIVEEHKFQAEQKKIALTFTTDLNEAETIAGNLTHFQQVLANLISNALKFSYLESMVSLRCNGDKGCINIAVSDQGQGLTGEDLQKIFGRRMQLSAKPTGGETSTGLGLFGAKQLTEKMGGTLTAHSEGAGLGATFILTFPRLKT